MSPRNGPSQAKAQPCSGLGATVVAAVESFENAGQICPGDTSARICNRDDHIVTLALRERNLNLSSRLRVFDGVIDNVGKHPLKHSGISHNQGFRSVVAQGHILFFSDGFEKLAGFTDKSRDVNLLTRGLFDSSFGL